MNLFGFETLELKTRRLKLWKPGVREHLSTGNRLRFSTEIFGSKREKTVFHENLQEACFVLTEISENIWKLPEFTGECNL